ncbi:MAG TPA: hypothetical protein VF808_19435 [Ktedonobacterales bacterium]
MASCEPDVPILFARLHNSLVGLVSTQDVRRNTTASMTFSGAATTFLSGRMTPVASAW